MFRNNLKEALEARKKFELDEARELFHGNKIDDIILLNYEYQKIFAIFTFIDGEDFDFEKYNDFRILLFELYNEIVNLHNEYDLNKLKLLKKIIVHLDLEFGIDITYYRVFLEMINNHELTEDYNEINKYAIFNFNTLSKKYGKNI